ncbi:predicted protein [Nematostella vectensis]|uniref:Uncharacterized protein n=1 Tax=Nematostella vectensis TaxID=45351 RepID=A7SWY3_NEMVE|nr:predicted protein [Nematostella vectensis]|eukprot:XP_001623890.1 predicted protein [Nematostella vectensis]
MAFCSYSQFVGGVCFASQDNPGIMQCVNITNCTQDIKKHLGFIAKLRSKAASGQCRYLDLTDSGALTFDKWCDEQRSAVSQFQYWYTYLQLELLLLVFVRSVRLDDFDMYRDALYKMLPWFFALNHTHYSRWLRVHVKDMCELDMKAPDVARAFREGLFAVTKTSRRFSAIAIDQAQEQNNALVKGDGGAVSLTENTNALRRRMLSGPEMARPVNEFEAEMNPEGTEKTFSDYAQRTFIKYILAQVRHVERIDLVFDEYIANSLKATTRSHRGAAVRQRVEPVKKLPRSWKDFLRDDRNKEELFKFLGESFVTADCHPKQVISPYGTEVLSSVPREDNFSLWLHVLTKKPTLGCSFMQQIQCSVAISELFCAQSTPMS